MSWKTGLISCGSDMSAPFFSTAEHDKSSRWLNTISRRGIDDKARTVRSSRGCIREVVALLAGNRSPQPRTAPSQREFTQTQDPDYDFGSSRHPGVDRPAGPHLEGRTS